MPTSAPVCPSLSLVSRTPILTCLPCSCLPQLFFCLVRRLARVLIRLERRGVCVLDWREHYVCALVCAQLGDERRVVTCLVRLVVRLVRGRLADWLAQRRP